MEKKLLNYGFEKWQVETLIKKKKLSTGHGDYILKGHKLTLKTKQGIKEIDLNN